MRVSVCQVELTKIGTNVGINIGAHTGRFQDDSEILWNDTPDSKEVQRQVSDVC